MTQVSLTTVVIIESRPDRRKDMISLVEKVCDTHWDNSNRIAAFQRSIYEDKHEFEFRKVEEWLDYSQVG